MIETRDRIEVFLANSLGVGNLKDKMRLFGDGGRLPFPKRVPLSFLSIKSLELSRT